MTQEKPFPPRTLAEALDYYAGADYINAINTAKNEAREEGKAEATPYCTPCGMGMATPPHLSACQRHATTGLISHT